MAETFIVLCGPWWAIGAPLRSRLSMNVALGVNTVAQGKTTFLFLCGSRWVGLDGGVCDSRLGRFRRSTLGTG